MILQDFLKENNFKLSDKGKECICLAIKNIYPNLNAGHHDDLYINLVRCMDLPKQDLIRILELTIRYARCYIFT